MPNHESSEPILLTLEGNNGKIELMESSIRIVLYKEKLHLGMGRKWDKSKIDKVHEIPKDTITKVELAKSLKTYQLHIHFPGAGLMGTILFFKEEQKPEAQKMMERLQASTEVAKLKENKNISKILEKRGISYDEVLLAVEGANGQIVLTDKGVIIGREGFWKKVVSESYTKGDKLIPYKNISGVQFKEPGVTWGYIQFTLPGWIERRGGSWDAASDENTITFNRNLEGFRKVRSIVEEKQYSNNVPTPQTPPTSSKADELTKLAALKRDGAITEEEYAQLKKDLLSNH